MSGAASRGGSAFKQRGGGMYMPALEGGLRLRCALWYIYTRERPWMWNVYPPRKYTLSL